MKDTWESSGVDIPRRLMKLRVTTSIMDHIDNKRMECWIYTLKKWYVFLFKGYKNDHQIWIPKFLKSLHWLQFIWMVCEMLQLQFQHLRHRWQNEKVTETMTRRSLYLWHDLFFLQAMEIWEIKKNLHELVWGLWWWRTLFEIQPKKINLDFLTKKIQIELENWRRSLRSHSCENETF